MKRFIQKNGLLLAAIAFLLVLNGTLGFILTRKAGVALTSSIRQHMLDISNTAASMIDGDVLASLKAEDKDTEGYQTIMKSLAYFQDNIDLKYIYCISDTGNGNFVFSVDPTVEDPGEFGSPIVYTDALYAASTGVASVDETAYSDEWGTFYSAYSPVFTSDGKVGGIVAVDISAEWYDEQVAEIVKTVVIVGVSSLTIGILIVVAITRRVRLRNRLLSTQITELGGKVGDLVREIENGGDPLSATRSAPETPGRLFSSDDDDDIGAKVLSMQDEIRKHIERIRDKAYIDTLTGVGNKAAYFEAVKDYDEMIKEKKADFAVVVMDLNGLKQINDNFGHECGDLALSDAATVLKKVFDEDHVYRIGGDEFFVIIDHADEEIVSGLFNRFDSELELENKTLKSYIFPLGISKGAAIYDPEEDEGFRSVFKRADMAMYEDKRAYYESSGEERRRL
ncbi:MAG: GGDEF domain-containing protein [Clostridia bacterium]|nr:GGDEF domain-containing protein [Clostridia bacterium]